MSGALMPRDVALRVRIAWRGAIFLVLVAYFATVYIAMRALQGGMGFSVGRSTAALLATIEMGLFVAALFMIVEVPEAWLLHRVPARRRERGFCPGCGYDMKETPFPCPECGSDGRVRERYQLSFRTVRRFLVLAIAALLTAVVLGESHVAWDEAAFAREVYSRRGSGPPYARPRAWPASFAWLRDDPAWGPSAPAPFQSPRIPGGP